MPFRGPKGYTFGAVLGPERVPKKDAGMVPFGRWKSRETLCFLMVSRSVDVSKATPNGIKMMPENGAKTWSEMEPQASPKGWSELAPKGTGTPFKINENN